MGWRTDQYYEDLQRAEERAYIASLPWHERMKIRAWNLMVTCIVAGVFCGMVWINLSPLFQ